MRNTYSQQKGLSLVEHSFLVAKSLDSLEGRRKEDLVGHIAVHEHGDFAVELEVSIPCQGLAGSKALACHRELAGLLDLGLLCRFAEEEADNELGILLCC